MDWPVDRNSEIGLSIAAPRGPVDAQYSAGHSGPGMEKLHISKK